MGDAVAKLIDHQAGCAALPPVKMLNFSQYLATPGLQKAGQWQQVAKHACRLCGISKLLHDVLPRRTNGCFLQLPGLGNGRQDSGEARPALHILRREVGAAREGLQLRGQEDAHGPAASALRRLNEGHLGRPSHIASLTSLMSLGFRMKAFCGRSVGKL